MFTNLLNKSMDYAKHYTRLVERAKEREREGYSEQHHIVPRCLGGDNSPENLVKLSPEEHYVAHQLLVKMYPNEQSLVYAALMMTVANEFVVRSNKLYGWLKRRYQHIAKQRTGEKNGSFGRPWYHNPETGEAAKFSPDAVPTGWIKGRVSQIEDRICSVCNTAFKIEKERRAGICSKECRKIKKTEAVKKQRIPISDETIEEIISRRDAGESLRSLAPIYGLNQWTIYDIVGRYTNSGD